MKDQDYELLSQYLDGELGAPQVLHLEQRLAAEPELKSCLAQMQKVDASLRGSFDVPGADNVPPHVTRMVQESADNVVAFPQRRKAVAGFAIAASLLAASGLLSLQTAQQVADSPMGGDRQLASALEQSASQSDGWEQLQDGRKVRMVLSFHTAHEGWCREYMLADRSSHWHGVACRGEQGWASAVLAEVAPTQDSVDVYRPAGANDSSTVESFITTQADDIPLSARAEAEVIANGWK